MESSYVQESQKIGAFNELGMEYFERQFSELKMEFCDLKMVVESTNAFVRQTLVLHKQSTKSLKTYFENENFDGFCSDLDIILPVSTEIELRDLEMRCSNEDFKKSFVSVGLKKNLY